MPGVLYNGEDLPLLPPVERYSTLLRGSYDLTDKITFEVSALIGGYNAVGAVGVSGNGGVAGTGSVTIRSDNAYLPAAVAALMPAGSSITFARRFQEVGLSENPNFRHELPVERRPHRTGRKHLVMGHAGDHGKNTFKQRFHQSGRSLACPRSPWTRSWLRRPMSALRDYLSAASLAAQRWPTRAMAAHR